MTIVARSARGLGRPGRVAAAMTGVLLAAALAACGGPAADEGSPSSGAASSGEGSTEYPLTLTSPWGETVLSKRPDRVAAVGWADFQLATSIGLAPVAAPQSAVANEVWTDPALTQRLQLRFGTKGNTPDALPPLEEIAATKPDLLLWSGRDMATLWGQVSPIAPVVASATVEDSAKPDWRLRLRQVAKAVDRADRAEKVIAGVDTHFAGIKQKYPEFAGKRVTFAVYYGPSVGLRFFSGAGSDTEKLLRAMGFAASPNAETFVGRNTIVAAEQMSLLDSDVLVVSDNSNGAIAALIDTPSFKSLPVVAMGRSVVITNNATHTPPDISYTVNREKKPGNLPWALAQPGPQSTPWAADQVAPVIAGVLKK